MDTLTAHKLIRRVKDESFDGEDLDQYTLLLQVGLRDAQVALYLRPAGKFILLEDYVFPEAGTIDSLNSVKNLFDGHTFLSAGFWKEVLISIKGTHFTQLPADLFDKSNAAEVLKINSSFDPQQEIVAWSTPYKNIVTIFSVQRSLYGWLNYIYNRQSTTFFHQSGNLVAAALNDTTVPAGVHVYIDRFSMHITAVASGKLLYYNQFVIKEFQDYIRYILLVMKTLTLDPEAFPVILWGFVSRTSPHFAEFKKFIRHVALGARTRSVGFSPAFGDVQDHFFSDIFAMVRK